MFKLQIKTDNAAFENSAADEIARILERLANDLRDSADTAAGKLRDANGNTVGSYKLTTR